MQHGPASGGKWARGSLSTCNVEKSYSVGASDAIATADDSTVNSIDFGKTGLTAIKLPVDCIGFDDPAEADRKSMTARGITMFPALDLSGMLMVNCEPEG
jgi:hypothetical protein